MDEYLAASAVVDWTHPDVVALARTLKAGDATGTARLCFEWVRDKIKHSADFQQGPVTCAASEVLRFKTGFCYAKSHLLAALLRANGIPAGLCYQRLSLDASKGLFCLHGLNAVHLPGVGWYRVDARGNKPGVNAQFVPPLECLAFSTRLPEEMDLRGIYSEPLKQVVSALCKQRTIQDLAEHLPDVVVSEGA